jgi:hypothetical protein
MLLVLHNNAALDSVYSTLILVHTFVETQERKVLQLTIPVLLDRHLEAIMKVLLIYDSESVPVDIAIYV